MPVSGHSVSFGPRGGNRRVEHDHDPREHHFQNEDEHPKKDV